MSADPAPGPTTTSSTGLGRRLLRRFAAVGVVVTAVDVAVLVGLAGAGWPVAAADAVAILAAAVVSFFANRALTFADDPAVRWVRHPGFFVVTTAFAGAIDVIVLLLVLSVLPGEGVGLGRLLVAKGVALAAASIWRWSTYRLVLFVDVQHHLATRTAEVAPRGAVRLSIVVPAYRERGRIAGTIGRIRDELADIAAEGGLDVVVVDDGSRDGTDEEARAAGADQVVVQPSNRGKGAAVRAGVLVARGATVAFTDADLAYPPGQVRRLLERIEEGWDVAVGSRKHDETTTVVRAPRLREIGGRVINRLTHAVLLGSYLDTQCGLKAFRSDVARLLFAKTRIDGFAFDVELFHLIERYRLSLVEVPVEVANSERSTVRMARDGVRLVRDLVRILRGARAGWYDLDDGEAALLAAREHTSGEQAVGE